MKRIVITGATGWVGRAMLDSLIAEHGIEILDKVELYGSKKQSMVTKSGLTLDIAPLESIKLSQIIDLFVPLAFLTQEKYNNLGQEAYRRINRDIISTHAKIIEATNPKATIYFSSGITARDVDGISRPDSYFAYKKLKLEEEYILDSLIASYMGHLITCKLFSMSGQFMRDPQKYALGDFILQASSKNSIQIKSSSLVYRKYFQDVDLCALMLQLAKENANITVESTGFLIELGELAQLVGKFFELSESSIVRENIQGRADNYYSQDTVMDGLFTRHGIKPCSLEDQIAATIKGVLADVSK